MKKNIPLLLLLGAGALLWYFMRSGADTEKTYLLDRYASGEVNDADRIAFAGALAKMSADEIHTMYVFMTQYFEKNTPVPDGSPLRPKLQAISVKYNIMT